MNVLFLGTFISQAEQNLDDNYETVDVFLDIYLLQTNKHFNNSKNKS